MLDLDLHGPNIPNNKIKPVSIGRNLKIISIGFLLKEKGTPIIWRGPIKMRAIEQFLGDVDWGSCDFLVIDLPPGTGDEVISLTQLLGKLDGMVVVTTPQDVALLDVEKAVNFAKELNIPIIGITENMSGFKCPYCGNEINLFGKGGEKAANKWNLRFLGRIPFDPRIVEWSDQGKSFLRLDPQSEAFKVFFNIIEIPLREG